MRAIHRVRTAIFSDGPPARGEIAVKKTGGGLDEIEPHKALQLDGLSLKPIFFYPSHVRRQRVRRSDELVVLARRRHSRRIVLHDFVRRWKRGR